MQHHPHRCDPSLNPESSRVYCCLLNASTLQHLFTCDLDGKELRSVADCVERLKLLDGMGSVWGQTMVLELRGANLLLTDLETKVSSVRKDKSNGRSPNDPTQGTKGH